MMKIILGSASKWRQQILKEAGMAFDALAPNINEKNIRDEDPEKLALALAHAKAKALLPRIHSPHLLITADQVVYCNGEIFEKPRDDIELRKFLLAYVQHPAKTITALVVTNTQTQKSAEGIDIATVYFSPDLIYSIENYLGNQELYHCAGGFQIENKTGGLNPFILKIEGEIDSVKGLPMILLKS